MDGSHMLACAYRPIRPKFDEWGRAYGLALPVLIGWWVMIKYLMYPIIDFIRWVRPEAMELFWRNWQ